MRVGRISEKDGNVQAFGDLPAFPLAILSYCACCHDTVKLFKVRSVTPKPCMHSHCMFQQHRRWLLSTAPCLFPKVAASLAGTAPPAQGIDILEESIRLTSCAERTGDGSHPRPPPLSRHTRPAPRPVFFSGGGRALLAGFRTVWLSVTVERSACMRLTPLPSAAVLSFRRPKQLRADGSVGHCGQQVQHPGQPWKGTVILSITVSQCGALVTPACRAFPLAEADSRCPRSPALMDANPLVGLYMAAAAVGCLQHANIGLSKTAQQAVGKEGPATNRRALFPSIPIPHHGVAPPSTHALLPSCSRPVGLISNASMSDIPVDPCRRFAGVLAASCQP